MIGLRSKNDAGTFQVDPSYSNLVARGPRTNWGKMSPGNPFTQNSPPPAGTTARSLIVSDNLFDSPYFGWNWGYCYLFQSPTEAGHQAISGVPGLRVRNENTGAIVWQHNLRILKVTDAVYGATNGWARTYPAGRIYRIAPISWGGLSIITDKGDAGMGDGSRLYESRWRTCYWNISGTTVSVEQRDDYDPVWWDGPGGMAGTVGQSPHISFLVIDVTDI